MLDGKRNARPEPQAKLLPAGVLGLKQKCSTNFAKSLMTIGADGRIRASAISVSRSGVSALAQCNHGRGLAGPGEWFGEIFGPVLGLAPVLNLEVLIAPGRWDCRSRCDAGWSGQRR